MSSGKPLSDAPASYEGFEDPHSFPSTDALEDYRRGLLERTSQQVAFLARRLSSPARALEVACGNGRLLIGLARRSLVESALGIDVARSRIAFAREWAAAEGHDQLAFEVGDALRLDVPREDFSAAVCITGAFAYFEPLEPGAGAHVAGALHGALEPGGLLILELYPRHGYRRLLEVTGGEAQIWKELPSSDPWRFYLSRLALDATGEVLTHQKTFIHRTSGEVDEGRDERLHLYSQDDLCELLGGTGFRELEFWEGWEERPYEGGELMVVTGLKE